MGFLPYTAGLHPIAPDAYAYLNPPGTWGLSNCGLIVCRDEALLVDTQFDLVSTWTLIDTIAAVVPSVVVTAVVNTHANGDHCWGNELFPEAEIIASESAAREMLSDIQPAELGALSGPGSPCSPLGAFFRRVFGAFDLTDITVTPPTRTFTGRLELDVCGRHIELLELGPAHTDGDVVVHLPDAGVVFAGDVIFTDDHPISWTGSLANWTAACDRLLDTGAELFVPGHGPITGRDGVRTVRDYLSLVGEHAVRAHAGGLPVEEAAARLVIPEAYGSWQHRDRLVMTLAAAYRWFNDQVRPTPVEALERYAVDQARTDL
jgi:cyclase